MFTATATAVVCDEEDPSKLCVWPADRIYITTTSSSLIGGGASVLIEYDPDTGEAVELNEPADILTDISFSSRGELFVTLILPDPAMRLSRTGLLQKVSQDERGEDTKCD